MHLPPCSPIFGRDAETAELCTLIDQGDLPILTLLGPGGVGKTRLAREVSSTLGASFAHGAHFVPLDAVHNPRHLPNALAHALGIWEQSETSIGDLLIGYLSDRHMLLVLDNMEHLAGGASPWLPDLIRQAPRLRVLVTSRIPLNIEAEQRYVVPPLEIPDSDLTHNAAVILFEARARAVNDHFGMDERTTEVVAEICRQLDGLPLAIELAAARTRMLSPEELLARLSNRLEILTGGHEDAPQRLRSMREAIAWSTELLTPHERRLFCGLSVFLNGFTLDAVEFIAHWPEPVDESPPPIDLLQSLMDQSLVQSAPNSSGTRYRILETIRESGLELARRAGLEHVRAAHADYIRDLARRAEHALMGPHQAAWLAHLESDYANIQTAICWLESQAREEQAIEIYAQLCPFIDLRGHSQHALRHLEAWLTLPKLQERSRARGLALAATGVLLHNIGAFRRAVVFLEEAVDILRWAGDHDRAVLVQAFLGVMYGFTENRERMRTILEETADEARTLGHQRALAASLTLLADDAWLQGDDVRFRTMLDDALQVARDNGDAWVLTFGLLSLSNDAVIRGRLDDAERYTRESLHIREELGSKRDIPADLMSLSWIARQRGDTHLVEEHLSTALRIAGETGHWWYQTLIRYEWGMFAIDMGDLEKARAHLAAHLQSFRQHQRLDHVSLSMGAHAILAIASGEAPVAARFLGAAANLATSARRTDPMFSVDTAEYERALITALGEHAFRREYEIGSSWSVEEAIVEALGFEPRSQATDDEDARTLLAPSPDLSPREMEVLHHMALGLSNQEIADALSVSHRTVTTHVTSILTKLHVQSRTAAVSFAIRTGLA